MSKENEISHRETKKAKDWNSHQTGGHRWKVVFNDEIDAVLGCWDEIHAFSMCYLCTILYYYYYCFFAIISFDEYFNLECRI